MGSRKPVYSVCCGPGTILCTWPKLTYFYEVSILSSLPFYRCETGPEQVSRLFEERGRAVIKTEPSDLRICALNL